MKKKRPKQRKLRKSELGKKHKSQFSNSFRYGLGGDGRFYPLRKNQ